MYDSRVIFRVFTVLALVGVQAEAKQYRYTITQTTSSGSQGWAHGLSDAPVPIHAEIAVCEVSLDGKPADRIESLIVSRKSNGLYERLYQHPFHPVSVAQREILKITIPFLSLFQVKRIGKLSLKTPFGNFPLSFDNHLFGSQSEIASPNGMHVKKVQGHFASDNQTLEGKMFWQSESVKGDVDIFIQKLPDQPNGCIKTAYRSSDLKAVPWNPEWDIKQAKKNLQQRRIEELRQEATLDSLLETPDAHRASQAVTWLRANPTDLKKTVSKFKKSVDAHHWKQALFIGGILAAEGSFYSQESIARFSLDRRLPDSFRESLMRTLFLCASGSTNAVRKLLKSFVLTTQISSLQDTQLLVASGLAGVSRDANCIIEVSQKLYQLAKKAKTQSNVKLARLCLAAAQNLGVQHAESTLKTLIKHTDSDISIQATELFGRI